ncbi:MAG: helix-turn-helix domain-containing protein [Pseudomonadales bacterium]|nr:helix-turn-helix domain-containing protein [Pseudomonadales bacterium]
MPKGKFDELIHAPNRLKICALLAAVKESEFRVIREELDVSDSVLSKQIKLLEEANYVQSRKVNVITGKVTWLSLTKTGRKAFSEHINELQRITELSKNPL